MKFSVQVNSFKGNGISRQQLNLWNTDSVMYTSTNVICLKTDKEHRDV